MARKATAVRPSPHCLLSFSEVDSLNEFAHRIVLYGNLITAVLEGHYKPEEEIFVEGLAELVDTTIADAKAIETLIVRGCQAATKGGA